MCPDKVLDTGTVKGIFRGVECGEACAAAIEVGNGELFWLLADEDTAEKAFGNDTGQQAPSIMKCGSSGTRGRLLPTN